MKPVSNSIFLFLFICLLDDNLNIFILENNSFIQNRASIGGAIKMKDKIIEVNLNKFTENQAYLYGNDVATYPIRLELLNKTKERLKNSNQASPGHYLDFSIDLCLKDHYSQIVSINEKYDKKLKILKFRFKNKMNDKIIKRNQKFDLVLSYSALLPF